MKKKRRKENKRMNAQNRHTVRANRIHRIDILLNSKTRENAKKPRLANRKYKTFHLFIFSVLTLIHFRSEFAGSDRHRQPQHIRA